MPIQNSLPNRRLKFDEFQEIQRHEAFSEVYTLDKPGQIDVLIVKKDGTEFVIEFDEDDGWEITEKTQL